MRRLLPAMAATLLGSCLLLWLLAPATTQTRIGGPFHLTAENGTAVTDRSFAGKYMLVYFGYTKCRDVCPATLSTLTAALDRLGRKAGRVQPLFITIDPARDTPAVLRQYVAAFGPRLMGLCGTQAELAQVAAEYHVAIIRPQDAGDTIDHSSVLYLLGPDGAFIAPIPADASEMVMAAAIARYIGA